MKRLVFWAAGFVVLLLINVMMESIILAYLGLHGPDNDLYFLSWWCVVIVWLLFGYLLIGDNGDRGAE